MPASRRETRERGKQGAGFTLLEVVVALAIAALALVELFRAGSGGLSATDTASRLDEAVERAQSHLAAVGHFGPIVPGRSGGDDGDGYRWEVDARPVAQQAMPQATGITPAAGSVQALYDIAVTISWRSGRRNRSVVLQTRRLAAAPPGE